MVPARHSKQELPVQTGEAPVVASTPEKDAVTNTAFTKTAHRLTRAQLKRKEASAQKSLKGDERQTKTRRAEGRIPSEREYLKARAEPIVRQVLANNGFTTKAAVVRRLKLELADELEELQRRREAAKERERTARATRQDDNVKPIRHSFYEVAKSEEPKKTDARRLKREQRRQEEAEARAAAPKPDSAQDCITAAEASLIYGRKALAASLLYSAADKLDSTDPLRLKIAQTMQKAKGGQYAVDMVEPLLTTEQHQRPALAFMAVAHLADGDSRLAYDLMERYSREDLRTLKATAQLSLGLRTDDAAACDKALADLADARFRNKGHTLEVDLREYPGMPRFVRLTASTLRYANHLGEALARNGRLYEAVQIYDSLRFQRPADPAERRDYIRALKSCGKAYYEYAVQNRQALGELSVPHSPIVAWSEHPERVALSGTAEKYFGRAFDRLFRAYEVNGTDIELRSSLSAVIAMTGDPKQYERVKDRMHRRQKKIEQMNALQTSDARLIHLSRLGAEEELSPDEERLYKALQRERQQQQLKAAAEQAALREQLTTTRQDTDKPAHMPTAQARGGRFYQGPSR